MSSSHSSRFILPKATEARAPLDVKTSPAKTPSASDVLIADSFVWTEEENRLLDDAMLQGKTLPEIQLMFPQRSKQAVQKKIKRKTESLNNISQQTTSQAPPSDPWLASVDEFGGYTRINTGYGGVAPNVNQHPDLVNGLDFTPTPQRPGYPPGFVTSKQMFWVRSDERSELLWKFRLPQTHIFFLPFFISFSKSERYPSLFLDTRLQTCMTWRSFSLSGLAFSWHSFLSVFRAFSQRSLVQIPTLSDCSEGYLHKKHSYIV